MISRSGEVILRTAIPDYLLLTSGCVNCEVIVTLDLDLDPVTLVFGVGLDRPLLPSARQHPTYGDCLEVTVRVSCLMFQLKPRERFLRAVSDEIDIIVNDVTCL